jgi:hypothetical protein
MNWNIENYRGTRGAWARKYVGIFLLKMEIPFKGRGGREGGPPVLII